MTPDEVLLSVHIPFTRENEFTREFKQSPRRDDDIAIVNAGTVHMHLKLQCGQLSETVDTLANCTLGLRRHAAPFSSCVAAAPEELHQWLVCWL